jgi:hypothetical protein
MQYKSATQQKINQGLKAGNQKNIYEEIASASPRNKNQKQPSQ